MTASGRYPYGLRKPALFPQVVALKTPLARDGYGRVTSYSTVEMMARVKRNTAQIIDGSTAKTVFAGITVTLPDRPGLVIGAIIAFEGEDFVVNNVAPVLDHRGDSYVKTLSCAIERGAT